MGFGEARAGRALLAIKGQATLESALSWIESHEDDSDIDEPLTEEILSKHKTPAKSPLSEEEAQRLAYELQKKLREVSCSSHLLLDLLFPLVLLRAGSHRSLARRA